MREGIRELEEAVAASPDWGLARRALAAVLIRAGDFERARDELVHIVGDSLAAALEAGEASAPDLPSGLDDEIVLGLAIACGETGRPRAADRLYRLYADMVGPNTASSAGAFWRLADMYEASGVGWGDADAQRAKALALDPDVSQKIVLPSLPDPASTPELEPYARPVEPAAGREHPSDGYDSLPVLMAWSAPRGVDLASGSLMRRAVQAQILVGVDGRVSEIVLPPEAYDGNARGEATLAAAAEWGFRPAVASGTPVASWVTLAVDVPIGAAPDSLRSDAGLAGEDGP